MSDSVISQELKQEVEALLNNYVQCIDDDELERWPDFFTDPCLYQVIPRENHELGQPTAVMWCDSRGMLEDRITALRHANVYQVQWYRHLISNPVIKTDDGDTFHVQSNYAVFKTCNDGDSTVYNVGRYVDEIVRDKGVLKFKKRSAIYDTHRITTLMVIPI
ncbi:MAG: anthranilate 1,2-dioxygenase [Cycloclasticus sp. Phe_18]|jgi:anthranilate 1,2-dioxygenase small subunit|nr:MAG: anthranilate 1,2-dioxygenase [Cycloclasticus sp. Phe_18]